MRILTKRSISIISLLLIHVPLTSSAQAVEENTSEFILFLGRFHPLILHLPIGFLLFAFLLHYLSKLERFANLQYAVGFALMLGMITAGITALFGYFLSLEGGYGQETLDIHQWLGYGTVILSILTCFLYYKFSDHPIGKRSFSYSLMLLVVVLSGTGHFGGALTHGEDYLTYYLPDGIRTTFGMEANKRERKVIENLEEAIVFEDLIMPILEEKCVACHSKSKTKGELILQNRESILKGGESGEVFIAGDPENSILIQNINLPEEDEEHMPPKGKKQLKNREKELLKWWIESGASFDHKVSQTTASESVKKILADLKEELSKDRNPVYSLTMDFVPKEKLVHLKKNGIVASYIAQNSPLIQIKIDSLKEPAGKLLGDLQEQTAWLDLSGSNCSDESLQGIGNLKNLTRLYLQNTKITDEGISQLSSLKYLEYINLYGNNISDKGLQALAGMEHLRSLYLWKTNVTTGGVKELLEKIPDLVIDLGEGYPASDTTNIESPDQRAVGLLF